MRPPQVNLQHIVTFYFVAREGGFGPASERLFITQSAVTQQVRSLEAQFGIKLFAIRKQRAYLTTAGERFFAYAEGFVRQAMSMESFLKSYRLNNLNIGVARTLMLLLMGLIDKFKERYPSVQVSVGEGHSSHLIKDLLNFRHDICFVSGLVENSEHLTVYRMPQVDEMVFVASPEYVLGANGSGLTWEDLSRHPLIMQSAGSAARDFAFSHFRERGLQPVIGAEVDHIECAKELARQKKGVAFMFRPNVEADLGGGKLKVVPVIDGEVKLDVYILVNRGDRVMSPTLEEFIRLFREHFKCGVEEVQTSTAPAA